MIVILQEHTFEVSLFAENFNEMIMRDFGLQIYKALTAAPEKVDEKEKKEKSDEKEKKDKDGKEKTEEKPKDGEKVEDVKKIEEDDGEESKDASEKAVTVNGKDEDDDVSLYFNRRLCFKTAFFCFFNRRSPFQFSGPVLFLILILEAPSSHRVITLWCKQVP